MAVIQKNSYGIIEFSDEFLSNLAGVATMDCYGIVGMASQKAMDGIVELLKGENLNKGVEITTDGELVHIHLFVIVEYGVSISAVASNVIDTVKYRVENITGLNVDKVDVTVNGIRV
ncbi:MAG: Asp23/Gls24 family envelope stress response protein [Eubacteriales bacterium]|nr:Asp23/Gls24 family envelope stress response protein [Eubacteriales bacterium]